MEQEYARPVMHSEFSAAANTAVGAAGGAVKTGLSTAFIWIGAFTLLGVAVGVTLATGGVGGLGLGAALSGLTSTLFSAPVVLGAIGGTIGLAFGAGTSWLPGGAGAVVGGLKGGAKASSRVANERAAAQEASAQIAMSQAQAGSPYAATPITNNIYADRKYNFPTQGTAMNAAMPSVQLDGAQLDGTAVGQQRATAL